MSAKTTIDLRGMDAAESAAIIGCEIAKLAGNADAPAPPYATSSDAALSLLGKLDWERSVCGEVTIWMGYSTPVKATAKSFPLAVCLAVLRAQGVEVLL